jgi:hypothetical protein
MFVKVLKRKPRASLLMQTVKKLKEMPVKWLNSVVQPRFFL